MAHPNEELTRRAYDAFSRGDVDTLTTWCAIGVMAVLRWP